MTNPRRKEKPLLPQPEPSVTSVKTHSGGLLSGVRHSSATQMLMEAKTALHVSGALVGCVVH